MIGKIFRKFSNDWKKFSDPETGRVRGRIAGRWKELGHLARGRVNYFPEKVPFFKGRGFYRRVLSTT